MDFDDYIRKPFKVGAVQITKENIAEVAELIGELRYKEEGGDPYVQVNRRLVPNLWRVYPGFWVTKMGDNLRCYSKKIFSEQFIMADDFSPWVDEFIDESPLEEDGDIVEESVG